MERKLNLLFGIIGGLFLVFLSYPPFNLSMALGSFNGYVFDILFSIVSFLGLIFIIYFSVILIIDAIKTIHKR